MLILEIILYPKVQAGYLEKVYAEKKAYFKDSV
jgi:hypothetical protein